MQLHEIKPTTKKKPRKRIGRGGKKGTYSGKGQKGQKSRSGVGIKPGFRGGDTPLWKLFPKLRGSTKKLKKTKKRGFMLRRTKPLVVNLKDLDEHFKDGDTVNIKTLKEKKLITTTRRKLKRGVKILGQGELKKKLKYEGVTVSKSASKKISPVQ